MYLYLPTCLDYLPKYLGYQATNLRTHLNSLPTYMLPIFTITNLPKLPTYLGYLPTYLYVG
jgi:hypothetical protein